MEALDSHFWSIPSSGLEGLKANLNISWSVLMWKDHVAEMEVPLLYIPKILGSFATHIDLMWDRWDRFLVEPSFSKWSITAGWINSHNVV